MSIEAIKGDKNPIMNIGNTNGAFLANLNEEPKKQFKIFGDGREVNLTPAQKDQSIFC